MHNAKKYCFAIVTAVLFFSHLILSAANACTTFCLFNGKDLIFGRNYDFPIGYGHVVINKRSVFKSAKADAGEQAAQWTSKYGSVTFNQFGRDNLMGGMNEAGLIVELMQLDATQYPAPDSRPALGCLEWIQYQLDNCATVTEVIQQAEKVRIRSHVGIHYLIADSKGEIASIEFLDGKLIYHRGDKMPVKALANSTYEESPAYLKRYESNAALPTSMSSLDRFVRAGVMAKNYQPNAAQSAIDYAFDILRDVAQGAHTQWSIVYDVRNLAVYFFTNQTQQVRHVNLQSFDFVCASPVKILDVNADISGNIASHFSNYTTAANRQLVMASFQNSPFTKHIPVSALEEIAKHPESSSCQNPAGNPTKSNVTTSAQKCQKQNPPEFQ
jgi:choloylglycine hydrolase